MVGADVGCSSGESVLTRNGHALNSGRQTPRETTQASAPPDPAQKKGPFRRGVCVVVVGQTINGACVSLHARTLMQLILEG